MHTHNEPFKQQLHRTSIFSSSSPASGNLKEERTLGRDEFERYWLATFVTSKFGATDHAIKETSLFFALDNFLELFSDSPILVLKREPIGIINSFASQDLYSRWQYQERYKQIQARAHTESPLYDFVFPEDNPNELISLTRLIFLNSLLLSQALENKKYNELAYESSVFQHEYTLQLLSSEVFLGKDFTGPELLPQNTNSRSEGLHLFNPNRAKSELECSLTEGEREEIQTEISRLCLQASGTFSESVLTRVKDLLCLGKDSYKLSAKRVAQPSAQVEVLPARLEQLSAQYIQDKQGHLSWRNTLVTNAEFCSFLNALAAQGVSNIIKGTQLLFNENMLHERGGRIHPASDGTYKVSEGFASHPVYWVTWLGAALFAEANNARLPTREEISALVEETPVDLDKVNAGHQHDDVIPSSGDQNKIHDIIGNLAVWCGDGPKMEMDGPGPSSRFIYGTSWNRPRTAREIMKIQSRPLTGNSRAVGICLVQDETTLHSTGEVVSKARRILDYLNQNPSERLHILDRGIIGIITGKL